jgi:hypothetical protein
MTTPPKDALVTTETHRDDPREWLARRISEFKDAPVTEAGRRHHDNDHVANGSTCTGDACPMRRIVLAIEAEAATAARSDEIDVETLARAVKDAIPRGYQVHLYPRAAADAIAREYARLRSEQGERTPRVDSEIDAT